MFTEFSLILRYVCLLGVIFSHNVGVCSGKTFKIAFLAPGPSSGSKINSATSVDGLKLALRSVVNNPNILAGHNIAVRFFDVQCNVQSAVTTAMSARTTFGPDVIVGPPCHEGLKMVAQLGTYWNIPVLNWYYTGMEFSDDKTYPTLVRMLPPIHLLSKSLTHVLKEKGVTEISMLFTDGTPWSLLEEPVRHEAKASGVQLQGVYKVASNMPPVALKQMFTYMKQRAKALVLACPFEDVRQYMLLASAEGMTNGNFTFIHLDPRIYTDTELPSNILSNAGWHRGDILDTQAKKAYGYLTHILFNPTTDKPGKNASLFPRSKYSEYLQLVGNNTRRMQPDWVLPRGSTPDVYSPYLCDAVVVWSGLVDMLFRQGKDYRDGKLLSSYIKRIAADGATGHISFSKNLGRLTEVYILNMQSDGSFKSTSILKFDKNEEYTATRVNAVHAVNQPFPGEPLTQKRRPPLSHGHLPSTTTMKTVSTVLTNISTTDSTTAKPTTQMISPTTKVPDIIARLKAIEDIIRMRNTQTEVTPRLQQAKSLRSTVRDTATYNSKPRTNKQPRVDPYLHNFEVRLPKKRKIYVKAQRILEQIRRTGDPNVAAFLHLALERLNAEEDLITSKQRQKILLRLRNEQKPSTSKKGITIMTSKQNQNPNEKILAHPKIMPMEQSTDSQTKQPVTQPTMTHLTTQALVQGTPEPFSTTTQFTRKTSPSRTEIPSSTIKNKTEVTTIQMTTPLSSPKSTVKVKTTISTTTKATPTSRKTTNFQVTPLNFVDTTTVITKIPEQKRQMNKRKNKGRKNRTWRRLRNKWLSATTTDSPMETTETTEVPDSELFAGRKVITSIVSEVTGTLIGKMSGEIQKLKDKIESMQRKTTKKPIQKESTKQIVKPEINRSLIGEISANVLTKLSGVSWLEQKPEPLVAEIPVPTLALSSQQGPTVQRKHTSTQAGKIIATFENTPQDVQLNQTPRKISQMLSVTPRTKIFQSPSVRTTASHLTSTGIPKPKVFSNWMSGLPPALSMQLFAVETVQEKRISTGSSRKLGLPVQTLKQKEMTTTIPKLISPKKNPYATRAENAELNRENALAEKRKIHRQSLKAHAVQNHPKTVPKNIVIEGKPNVTVAKGVFPGAKPQLGSLSSVQQSKQSFISHPVIHAIQKAPQPQEIFPINSAIQFKNDASLKIEKQPAVERHVHYVTPLSVHTKGNDHRNVNHSEVQYVMQKQTRQEVVQPPVPRIAITTIQPIIQPSVPSASQQGSHGMNNVISDITNSVAGVMNEKMDSLQHKEKKNLQVTITTVNSKGNLQNDFNKPMSPTADISKKKLIQQISDAVIMQLNRQVNGIIPETTTHIPTSKTTVREHVPKRNVKNEQDAGSSALVDKIADRVMGKMTAKIDELSKSVSNIQDNLGRGELEEILPSMFDKGQGHQTNIQEFRKIPMQPNMMMPFPAMPPRHLSRAFSSGSNPASVEITPKPEEMTANRMAMQWMPQTMNPWISMQNQPSMWGSGNRPSNSQNAWWE